MPKTSHPPTPSSPDTRARILDAAATAWHGCSFDGVGTAEICRLAKVHKGSFFHFFPSKDDLLLAVLAHHEQALPAELRRGPFAKDLPPLQRFTRLFEQRAKEARQQARDGGGMRGCPIGNVVQELATRSPAVRRAAARVFEATRAVFQEALDEAVAIGELAPGTDTEATATAVLVFLQGMAVVGKALEGAPALGRATTLLSGLLQASQAAAAPHTAKAKLRRRR